MMQPRVIYVLIAFLFLSIWPAHAAVKCSATLIYSNTGKESQVALILVTGQELMAIGYEKSTTTGARVRRSEVYAVISFGEGGHLILEIPNLRAGGNVANKGTFDDIVTRGKIHTKSFNSEYNYSLELHGIVDN